MPIAFMSVTRTMPGCAAVKRRVEVEEITAGERLICVFATFTIEIDSVASELEDSTTSSLLEERTVSLLDEIATEEELFSEEEESATELEEAVEFAAVTVIVPDFETFAVAPVVVTVNLYVPTAAVAETVPEIVIFKPSSVPATPSGRPVTVAPVAFSIV